MGVESSGGRRCYDRIVAGVVMLQPTLVLTATKTFEHQGDTPDFGIEGRGSGPSKTSHFRPP
eukprot:8783130-Pyramimonas_sp.AAC.1